MLIWGQWIEEVFGRNTWETAWFDMCERGKIDTCDISPKQRGGQLDLDKSFT